jgi:hypothetical protein
VGAIPGQDSIFEKLSRGEIKTGGFDLNGGWSPWYTVHKLMAGLIDAYIYCQNKTALRVAVGMAEWTGHILKNLDNSQLQKMLSCEFGGMSEVLANIYACTGNQKWLSLSGKFYHRAILDPLEGGKDSLSGKHSNTQIPKIIGCARRYELIGDVAEKKIAENFWEIMVSHHSYAIGGNSDHEYLDDPDKLSDYLSESTCETCNTYNMLKLTRHLFCWHPDSRLGDYYERALYNHILSSQNPQNGMMCYFVPLSMGARKEFSDSFNTFSCCVGSGMENHSKYGEGIYYQGSDGSLYVNLFIPSELNWKKRNILIRQLNDFSASDTARFEMETSKPLSFIFRIRKPAWADSGISLTVNGKIRPVNIDANGFIVVTGNWKNHDRIELVLPMHIHLEPTPDNAGRVALLYGPFVLAGNLGNKALDETYDIPVFITDNRPASEWIKPVSGAASLVFQTIGTGRPADVTFTPFYENYNDFYSIYWDIFTKEGWQKRELDYLEEKHRQKDIEDRTVDLIRIGEMQPEKDHRLESQNSYTGEEQGRKSRVAHSGGYFSFDMNVDSAGENVLLVTYWGGENHRTHEVLIDGMVIATQSINHDRPNRFFDAEYPIPRKLSDGKKQIRISFQTPEGRTGGDVFGCRILRKEAGK